MVLNILRNKFSKTKKRKIIYELFNEHKEILDFPKAKSHFKEIDDKSPDEIISHLNKVADQWRGSRPLSDDMTFVILKFTDT